MGRMRAFSVLAAAVLGLGGCTSLGGGVAGGDGGWRLVYAAGADGAPLAGDKTVLMRAVRAGLPVRVVWGISWTLPDGTPGGVEHVADAAFVSIYKDEVFAQLPPFLQQAPDAKAADITLATDEARFVVMLDTRGRATHVMNPGREVMAERVATYWYVPWRSGSAPATIDVPRRLY